MLIDADLVERLRAKGARVTESVPLMDEAADEIERLRALIGDIEIIAGEFGQYPEPADALLAIEQFIRRAVEKGIPTPLSNASNATQ